jgi:serine/threonine-protein kinase RsbW
MEKPQENSPVTMVYPAQYNFLDDVREFVERNAEQYGLDSSATYAVQLAVDEAFTNIIEHAYGGECTEEIECTCQVTREGLVITLKDCGRIFNPDEVPEPDLSAELEERQIGGLGLYFIRRLMDDVQFSIQQSGFDSRDCNVLRMVKRKEQVG